MTTPLPPLHPALSVGPVEVSVSDLDRSVAFYQQALGMSVLSQDDAHAQLGVPGRVLLQLRARPGALLAGPGSPGLYHFAVLLPTRADLGRLVRHLARLGLRLGQGDHLVSEAFYLNDPDGHGIEVYADRPREGWPWANGEVQMGTDPVDVQGLLSEAGPDETYTGLPDNTVMGHVHLRVSDINAAEAFYHGVLGFDVTSRWSGQALFVSVGGYHHHLGLNTWQSRNGRAAPEHSLKLEAATLQLPDAAALNDVARRLDTAGVAYQQQEHGLEVLDPSGNRLLFSVA